MHNIEPSSFCSLEQFERHLPLRVQSHELAISGLYMAMARLAPSNTKRIAFQFPIQPVEVNLHEAEPRSVKLSILDSDLKPGEIVRIKMLDGISREPELVEQTTRLSIKELYLRGYNDMYPSDILELPYEINLPEHELVAA